MNKIANLEESKRITLESDIDGVCPDCGNHLLNTALVPDEDSYFNYFICPICSHKGSVYLSLDEFDQILKSENRTELIDKILYD